MLKVSDKGFSKKHLLWRRFTWPVYGLGRFRGCRRMQSGRSGQGYSGYEKTIEQRSHHCCQWHSLLWRCGHTCRFFKYWLPAILFLVGERWHHIVVSRYNLVRQRKDTPLCWQPDFGLLILCSRGWQPELPLHPRDPLTPSFVWL